MTFATYLRRLGPALDQALADWLSVVASDLPPRLQPALSRSLADGKRLRAGLLCIVARAWGGSLDAALPRAVAIECIQAASLIHDDYVDADTLRRERPAAWTLEGGRKAVLLGDLLFASAIERMMALSTDDGRVIARAIAAVAKGAYQEPTARDDTAAADAAYERIIFLKTGALFAAATELGAIAAAADVATRRVAHDFGSRVGEAYQIADDLHDLAALGSVTTATLPPALMPAVLRCAPPSFGRTAGGDIPLDSLLPAIRQRMQRILEARLDAARDALTSFPPSAWRTLLHQALEEIIAGASLDPRPPSAIGGGQAGFRACTMAEP